MSEHEEYTAETYPSFGKKYNSERAIISLTSWKARINTVSKTLFSLLKQCPGFHIVLVLSEEEFPKMMYELPDNLKLFVDNELIEVLWVYKNYRSFKKVLFTMDKYRTVPVISADDDCIYTCNYAQMLYDAWLKNKDCIITKDGYSYKQFFFQRGPATLYRPYCYMNKGITCLTEDILNTFHDDVYYGILANRLGIKIIEIDKKCCYIFHDAIKPLSETLTLDTIACIKKYNSIYFT